MVSGRDERTFLTIEQFVGRHAKFHPDKRALVEKHEALTYAQLDEFMDRIAAGLRRAGVAEKSVVALLAATTIKSAAVFLGVLRAGCVPAFIASGNTADQTCGVVADSQAVIAFVDEAAAGKLQIEGLKSILISRLDEWLPAGDVPHSAPNVEPGDAFNIIYSSGTTGKPKGIVQSHGMRDNQNRGMNAVGFGTGVTIICTPLYSNTTQAALLPTLVMGGTAILLGKFDARSFLEASERERATHAMLVPVQYQRIMAVPDFDRYDLSSFELKTCTSAPFPTDLKRDVVTRWPGMLFEIYSMTEGGGTTILPAHLYPDKLHTVGLPGQGHDIRIIGSDGTELPRGEVGEIVGRSPSMMSGYHGQSDATDKATWISPEGEKFIRHGDLGCFDEDGFLILHGRSKDMIISGGQNIYPIDIEALLIEHPDVEEAAVIGVPSNVWGETPFAFVVAVGECSDDEIRDWINARLGKMQRVSGVRHIEELPRNAIGKVVKAELLRGYFDSAA